MCRGPTHCAAAGGTSRLQLSAGTRVTQCRLKAAYCTEAVWPAPGEGVVSAPGYRYPGRVGTGGDAGRRGPLDRLQGAGDRFSTDVIAQA